MIHWLRVGKILRRITICVELAFDVLLEAADVYLVDVVVLGDA